LKRLAKIKEKRGLLKERKTLRNLILYVNVKSCAYP